jgi:hypothetical protein
MDGNLDIFDCRIIATACNDNGAIAISSCRSSGSSRRAFFGDFAEAQGHPRDSMAKVKLGRKEFDVDSEEIWAVDAGVTVADCVALAARIKSGEISRLKKLFLVRLFSVVCVFCFISSISTSHPRYFTAKQ